MSERQHPISTESALDRPFLRAIIGICIAISLFYFATTAFDDVIDGVVESKYEWVADRFTRSVNHIHKEWMITRRPKTMVLDYYFDEETTQKITVQLNKYGWPLNVSETDKRLNCLNLWMLFAHEVDHAESMMDLTADLDVQTGSNQCTYFHQSSDVRKFLFDYDLRTGKVSKIIKQR